MPQPVRQQQRHFQRQADAVSGGDPRSRVHQAKAPAAVAYNLSFTGITPALKVEVTAQFESIYKEFDLKFGANIPIPVETPASFWLGFDSVIKTAAGSETGDQGHRKHAGRRRGQRERVGTAVRQGRDLEKLFSATLKPNDDSNPQAKSASDAILDSLIASDKKEGEEAGKGGLFPSASLEIKLVRIEETKSLNFNYTSSKALSQSAVPQNFIGSDILHAQKTAPYFIQVNVNDPFFQQLDLTVLGPDSFEEYGIKATTFNIRYNHQVYTAAPFTKDDGTWTKRIARSSDKNELFHITSDFAFKSVAASGWEGSSSYQSLSQSASTLLNMDPGSVLSFNEISIFLDRKFSWENCNQVMVELSYQDDKGSRKIKRYTLTKMRTRAKRSNTAV